MIRFWMNSTMESEPAPKPFRNHKMEATRTRYAQVWTQLILFCLRTIDPHVVNIKIDYDFNKEKVDKRRIVEYVKKFLQFFEFQFGSLVKWFQKFFKGHVQG